MKYSYCEALIWHVMAPAAFRYLSGEEPGGDIPALKRRSKQGYRQMVARTPDIGSLGENPLRVCLTAGMLWLSVYEAAEGKMNEERFAGLVDASMNAALVKASFTSKGRRAFTRKAQEKRAADAARANAAPCGGFNWRAEVILGRDGDEYTILYRRCGLCALGRQEGLQHLVPYMCAVDTLSFDWMGGRLTRTQTLASGGEQCDFYICRKGSKWDKARMENRRREEKA